MDRRDLAIARLADADAHDRDIDAERVQPGDQTGMGSGAAGRRGDPVEGVAALSALLNDLLRAEMRSRARPLGSSHRQG